LNSDWHDPRMDGQTLVWESGDEIYYALLNQGDLSVTYADIVFSPYNPVENSTVDVTVTIHNNSPWGVTEDITVCLYVGNPGSDGDQPIGEYIIEDGLLGYREAEAIFSDISVDIEGAYEIYVRIFASELRFLISMSLSPRTDCNSSISSLVVIKVLPITSYSDSILSFSSFTCLSSRKASSCDSWS